MIRDIENLRSEYKKEGYAIIEIDDGPIHSYPYDAPWMTDEKFSKIYNIIRRNTLVDRARCYSIYRLVDQVRKIEGDVLEVGTWRGGTAGILTKTLPDKIVYLADTFEGVVKAQEWEHYKDKAHDDTSEQLVIDFLYKNVSVNNFKILKGIFPEDTGGLIKDVRFCLVYLDLDVYLSTKDAFNYIWNKLSRGGIVIFDDYGMISACGGISRFVDEIKDDEDKIFIQNINGQAYIIKK